MKNQSFVSIVRTSLFCLALVSATVASATEKISKEGEAILEKFVSAKAQYSNEITEQSALTVKYYQKKGFKIVALDLKEYTLDPNSSEPNEQSVKLIVVLASAKVPAIPNGFDAVRVAFELNIRPTLDGKVEYHTWGHKVESVNYLVPYPGASLSN
jgi:hypothetical protein